MASSKAAIKGRKATHIVLGFVVFPPTRQTRHVQPPQTYATHGNLGGQVTCADNDSILPDARRVKTPMPGRPVTLSRTEKVYTQSTETAPPTLVVTSVALPWK